MPFSVKTALVAALASVATAFPSGPKLNSRQLQMYDIARRQANAGQQAGLTDVDILQL